MPPDAPRENVARLISKYDLCAAPVLDPAGRILGIVTVDDVIDAIVETDTSDAQKLGGMEALDAPYMATSFCAMIKKRAGWLCALFLSEMLTASAMQHFETELEKAVVLTLFIPLIMSSGGNSGSQATSLIIRALALAELKLSDWWRVALRELPSGLVLGSILGVIGFVRITLWQKLGIYDYGEHWVLIAADRRRRPGRHRHLRLAVGIDAALHPAKTGLRPRQRLGALRRDPGRRDRPGDLFLHRHGHPGRNLTLGQAERLRGRLFGEMTECNHWPELINMFRHCAFARSNRANLTLFNALQPIRARRVETIVMTRLVSRTAATA